MDNQAPEWVNVGINAALMVITVVTAIIGIQQTRKNRIAAGKSETNASTYADQSLQASERLAAATEAQARLADAQRPPVWSEVTKVSKATYSIRNNSTDRLILDSITLNPELLSRWAAIEVPACVEHGDFFTFVAPGVNGRRLRSITLTWRTSEGSELMNVSRNIPFI
ncbi:hypothetical protein GCM10022198_00500 [Klugiella xanthotipulae]|uniref:Uncharacterized protein n=1 Tax=Klugiella xanthotipulae TaxID=244735 RepID=A0A543I5J3_9MICO|nr:hypothetical protein [Klugiella xanthotipulae]TQM65811.1 hypothetical protein FB466_0624 [Klugiella xanthotipulae]